MPELPEVEAAMTLLRSRAVGRTIVRARVLHPALRRRLTPAQLRALVDARIDRVERRGKHQLLHLNDGRILHAHFRMNGDWELSPTGAELPRFARAVLDFDDGNSLAFVDSRALGTIDLHPAGVALDLGLGPDAADPEWTSEMFGSALAARAGPIKPALLDQRLIAGLGNIYAAESLWRARISPSLPCNALGDAQVRALREAISAVLERATGARYTDDSTETLDVYDRVGQPCRRCRSAIERVTQAGRSTYFCSSCQSISPGVAKRGATKGAKRVEKGVKKRSMNETKSSGVEAKQRSKNQEHSAKHSAKTTKSTLAGRAEKSAKSGVKNRAK